MGGGDIVLGLDISVWQRQPDFDRIPAEYAFIVAKSSEGNGFIDPTWRRNIAEIRRIGRIPGAFHYARPDLGNSPQAEADWWLNAVGNPEGMLLQADHESAGGSAGWSEAFCVRVRDQLQGYHCLFYSYWSWIAQRAFWQRPGMSTYPLWFAWPASNGPMPTPLPWDRVAIQQDGVVAVPGIVGDVDFDRFFGNLADLRALTVGGGATPAAQEIDMQGIVCTSDQPDRYPRGIYFAEAFQLSDGSWYPVRKRYIPDDATTGAVAPVLGGIRGVRADFLDMAENGPVYSTNVQPPEVDELLSQLKTKVDELDQPSVDVATLAPILVAALVSQLPPGADPHAIAHEVVSDLLSRVKG